MLFHGTEAEGGGRRHDRSPFFALRRYPQPEWQGAGTPARGPYVVDKGFAGAAWHMAWQQQYGAVVICPSNPTLTVDRHM